MGYSEENSRRRWQQRLHAVGWASWNDVAEWAVRNDKGWTEVAQRLGVSRQHAWETGRAHGVTIPSRSERMHGEAEAHVAEHGTLLNARGELATWLAHLRSEAVGADRPRAAITRLDGLDPEWRLPEEARAEALERHGLRTHYDLAAFERMHTALNDAGFIDAADVIQWAITTHVGTAEIATQIGISNDGNVLSRLTKGNPVDPLAVTKYLRISKLGHLEDDGARVQCHECGLWFPMLAHHLKGHRDDRGRPLTAATYRTRNGLAPNTKLRTRGTATGGRPGLWQRRFEAAGFSSWEDVLVHGATQGQDPSELAALIGAPPTSFVSSLTNARPEDPWAATRPFRLSRHGHLETDGDRAQCHECGLWYRKLGKHSPRTGPMTEAGSRGQSIAHATTCSGNGPGPARVNEP